MDNKSGVEKIWRKFTAIPQTSLLVGGIVILFFAISLLLGVSILFSLVMLFWCGSVVFAFLDIKNRAAYLVYLLAFFLFLLGGEFLELYFGYPQEYTFDKSLDNHAYVSLMVSLIFVLVGYMGLEYLKFKKKPAILGPHKMEKPMRLRIRYFAKLALCICVIPYFLKTIDASLYTLKNGYLSYYTTYQCRLPGGVEVLSEMFTMFLFVYLATMPPKKKCLIPLALYFINGCLGMLTGRRISLGIAVLVVLFYVIVRHTRNPQEGWVNKKVILIGLVACPIMLLILHVQRYLRYDSAVEGGSVFGMIASFFSQQGFSINILKLQKELSGDSLGCTSLYYTLHYLRGNVITRHLFDFPMEYYVNRTVETALQTNCLADYIMYMVDANDFFAGYGLGTSYIAELYHDLRFFGIAAGSAVYGVILNGLFSLKHFSFWRFVVGMMMLEEFAVLPRYGADVILRPFYNLTKMGFLIIFIVLVYVSKEKVLKLWNIIVKKGA